MNLKLINLKIKIVSFINNKFNSYYLYLFTYGYI